MDALKGEVIGDIHITVCKTSDGDNFFEVHADNNEVIPVLEIIEDTLIKY